MNILREIHAPKAKGGPTKIEHFQFLMSNHNVKKSKETKNAKHPHRFSIYGAKMLVIGVAASKVKETNLYLNPRKSVCVFVCLFVRPIF